MVLTVQQESRRRDSELRSTDSRRRSGNIDADHPYEKKSEQQKWLRGSSGRGSRVYKTTKHSPIAETYLYLVEGWERACKRIMRQLMARGMGCQTAEGP